MGRTFWVPSLALISLLLSFPVFADDRTALLDEIATLETDNNYGEILEKCRQLIQIDPDRKRDYLMTMTRTYQKMGLPSDRFYGNLEKLLAEFVSHERNLDYYRMYADLLGSVNNEDSAEKAIELKRRIVEIAPDDWRTRQEIAEYLARTGAFEPALQEYLVLIERFERDTNRPQADHYRNEALSLYLALGDNENAKRMLVERYGRENLQLARAYEQCLLWDEAEEIYERLLQQPENLSYDFDKQAGAFFLGQGEVDRAFTLFRNAAQQRSVTQTQGRPIDDLVEIVNCVEQASPVYVEIKQAAIRQHQERAVEYMFFYEYLKLLNEYKLNGAAIDYCREILATDPNNLLVRLELVSVLHRVGRNGDCLEEYDYLRRNDPGHAIAYGIGYAKELLAMGKMDGAVEYCRTSLYPGDSADSHRALLGVFKELLLVDEVAVEVFALESIDPESKREYRKDFIVFCYRTVELLDSTDRNAFVLTAIFKAANYLVRLEPHLVELHREKLRRASDRIAELNRNGQAEAIGAELRLRAYLYRALESEPQNREYHVREIVSFLEQRQDPALTDKAIAWVSELGGELPGIEVKTRLAELLFTWKQYDRAVSYFAAVWEPGAERSETDLLKYYICLDRLGEEDQANRLRTAVLDIIAARRAWQSMELSKILYRHGYRQEAEAIWDRMVQEDSGSNEIMGEVYVLYDPRNARSVTEVPRYDKLIYVAENALANAEFQGFYRVYFMQELPWAYLQMDEPEKALVAYTRYAEDRRNEGYPFPLSQFYLMAMNLSEQYRTSDFLEQTLIHLEHEITGIDNQRVIQALDWLSRMEGIPYTEAARTRIGNLKIRLAASLSVQPTAPLDTTAIAPTIAELSRRFEGLEAEFRKAPNGNAASRSARGGKYNSLGTSNDFYQAGTALVRLYYSQGAIAEGDAVASRLLTNFEVEMGLAHWVVHQLLGIYADYEQYDHLADLCEKILVHYPAERELLETLALAHEKMRRFEDAARDYRRIVFASATNQYSSNSYYYKKLGECYLQLGDETAAVKTWQTIFRTGDCYNLLELLGSYGYDQRAEAMAEQAMHYDPYDMGLRIQQIEILLRLNQREAALVALVEMQKRLLDSGYLKYVKSHTLGLYEQYDCEDFLLAQAENDATGWWANELGDFYLVRGDVAKAFSSRQRAIVLAPDNAIFQTALALTLREMGERETAILLYKVLVAKHRMTQQDLLYYDLELANEYYLTGDLGRAEKIWREMEFVLPESFESCFVMGRMLFNHRQYRQAREYLEKASRISPGTTEVMQTLVATYAALEDDTNMQPVCRALFENCGPYWLDDLLPVVPDEVRRSLLTKLFGAPDITVAELRGSALLRGMKPEYRITEDILERWDDRPPREIMSDQKIRMIKYVNALSRHERFFDYLSAGDGLQN